MATAYEDDEDLDVSPARFEQSCGKRRFTSVEQARRACRSASFRFRIYGCPACHGFHVANADKRSY